MLSKNRGGISCSWGITRRMCGVQSAFYSILPWALFALMGAVQYIFIVVPGLQVQDKIFDITAGPQGVTLGVMMLFTYGFIAAMVAWIESGRPSKYAA